MLRKDYFLGLIAGLASLAIVVPAHADKANDTLIWTSDQEIEKLDNYYQTSMEGAIVQKLLWDKLIYRPEDKPGVFKPNLATSWTWIDNVTLEMKLRKGVKFHNGEPFSADDVKYTIDWIRDKKNKARGRWKVGWIKSIEKVDEYTIRMHLKGPFQAALEYLASSVIIYPNEYYKKVGPKGMSKHPIGTGPYKFVSQIQGKSITFEKNKDYFGANPELRPSIGKIVFRPIPDKTTQLAELISGGIDWVWRVPTDQLSYLKAHPATDVDFSGSLRVGYIGMDVSGRTKDKRLQDVRVRRAIAHAIDRETMVKTIVGDGSQVIHAPCHPIAFGCMNDDVTKYDYNPAKARALLKEAGYPNGFTIDLYAYRDRPFTEAVIGYLRAVGIKAKLRWMRYPTLRNKLHRSGTAFFHMTWGAPIYDASGIQGRFFSGDKNDYGRDPEVKKWINQAATATDPKDREKFYRLAQGRITDQVHWLPMFTYPVSYAFNKDLNLPMTADGVINFNYASWK